MNDRATADDRGLERGLGVTDAALVTVGSVLGTAIFITPADVARVLPHPGLMLLAWVLGGLITLAGTLTYAELGALLPRAGGQYVFLKEAYGRFYGFLFGWVAFLVIMSGGIAAIAVGFGEYLGAFLPFFSTGHTLLTFSLGGFTRSLNGGQLAGAIAIAFLTVVNYVGLRSGAGVQNLVTVAKLGSILGLGILGFLAPAPAAPTFVAPLPAGGGLLTSFGVAMIGIFWAYDGWYGMTNLAGEMRNPERDLPRGLVLGTITITVLYLILNLVFLRALPIETLSQSPRVAEAAAAVLFGSIGARLLTAAVLVSAFGCLAATILYAPRIYLPMAQDRVFFPALARIHPRYRTPANCILAQGAWSILLVFSGSYDQLYTFVVFALLLFHTGTGAAVVVLRRTRPTAPRPFRVPGYPFVPGVFVLVCFVLLVNTLFERPVESLLGLGILGLGVPAYLWWRRQER
jgi:basic amino acid/polyamine antiporter, APA family